jgi:ABC-type nitrate/sulfonate/bicarbonate transport system substrate-binding protein
MTMRTIGRRRLITAMGLGGVGLIAAPGLLAACGESDEPSGGSTQPSGGSTEPSGEAAPATLNVQLGWIANVENAGPFVAAEKGYYEDENLEVTLTPGGPGAILEPTVVSGTALIGLSSADTIANANAEGADLVIVGTTLQRNPSAVMSLADSPVNNPQELEGKRLGLQQSGEAIYDAFFRKAGVDASAIEIVPVQFDPAPLVAGEVDAFAAFQTNQPIALRAQGIDTVSFLLADFGYNLFANAFFITRETFEDDAARDVVIRWLRATRRGWEDAIADPGAAAEIVVSGPGADLDLDLDQQTETLQELVPLIDTPAIADHGLFWMTEDAIAVNVETMNSVGISVDESLFSNELLDAS